MANVYVPCVEELSREEAPSNSMSIWLIKLKCWLRRLRARARKEGEVEVGEEAVEMEYWEQILLPVASQPPEATRLLSLERIGSSLWILKREQRYSRMSISVPEFPRDWEQFHAPISALDGILSRLL